MAVLLIWFTWGRNERVGSRTMPRFHLSGGRDDQTLNVEGEILSGEGEGVWTNDEAFRFIA